VSTEGGTVTLDLKALLGQTAARVGVGERAEQRLPESAAQIEILESDQLGLAQDLVDFLQVLAIVLVVLALGLLALAVWLARGWRREALRASGLALIAGGAAALLARSLAGDAVVGALAGTEAAEPAAQATWDIGTRLLEEAAVATLGYGVVLVVAAWLAGPTGWAVSVRRSLAPYLREPRYAYGAVAALFALVLLWGPTPGTRRFLPALLLLGLLLLGTEALRRQTAREYPEASLEEASERRRERFSRMVAAVRGGTRRAEPAPAAESSRMDELERLGKLRDSGLLDPEEFQREKRRILGSEPLASS
jgi:hypothetical protein